jgi:hypothetical protein
MAPDYGHDQLDDFKGFSVQRRRARGTAFGLSSGCLLVVLTVTVGLPVLACGGFLMLGFFATAVGPQSTQVPQELVSKQQKAARPQTIEYRELAASTKSGRKWRAIVIQKRCEREQLIRLASDLHKADPTSSFRFFDDDEQYEAFRIHDENYPNPRYPFPEVWVNKHYIGLLNKIGDAQGSRWELWAMPGGFHLLSGGQSQTIAVIE